MINIFVQIVSSNGSSVQFPHVMNNTKIDALEKVVEIDQSCERQYLKSAFISDEESRDCRLDMMMGKKQLRDSKEILSQAKYDQLDKKTHFRKKMKNICKYFILPTFFINKD